MKRILCILSSLDSGGAETFLMKIYRSLPKEQYQFDFIVSVDGGCYTQEVLDRGGRIYKVPLRTENLTGVFRGIKSIVRDNDYDFVLKLGENSLSVVDLIAAKLGGAQNVVLRACNAPTGVSFLMRCLHRVLRPVQNAFSDVKIAPSKLAAEYMFGRYAKVNQLNNGVDLSLYNFDGIGRQNVRAEFGVEHKLVIGHVGRFHEQKNHRFLIDVFSQIHQKHKDSILLLVGVGKLEEEIRGQIKKLGLEECVILTGQRFDVPQLLSAMDIFVFPSFHEGMPNTVIEAQATGLPCIIADTITREANITGLVQYLPLEKSPEYWADVVLSVDTKERKDTKVDFIANGYDIKSVAKRFVELVCGE